MVEKNDNNVIQFLCNCFSDCYLLPENPLDKFSIWTGQKCKSYQMNFEDVNQIIKKLQEEQNSLTKNDIQAHLEFMKKIGKIVHKNSYILSMTYHWLFSLTSTEEWKDKMKILEQYLKLLQQLNLGLFKDKARVLFEIGNISLVKANKNFQNGKIKESHFKNMIKIELLPIFSEVRLILRFDSKSSFEGKIYSAVESYIRTLRNISK